MPSRVQIQSSNSEAFERVARGKDVNILGGMSTTTVAFAESLTVSLSRIVDIWMDQEQVLRETEAAEVSGRSEKSFKRGLDSGEWRKRQK